MSEIEIIGWLGGFLLAICAIPQALASYKQKHSDGISQWMIWLWGIGEVLALAYVLNNRDWPLILNYGLNTIFVVIIAYYKYFPHYGTKSRSVTTLTNGS